eukprot:SAG31_NODE_49_length_30599_cov_15.615016_28_plen_341_part_00
MSDMAPGGALRQMQMDTITSGAWAEQVAKEDRLQSHWSPNRRDRRKAVADRSFWRHTTRHGETIVSPAAPRPPPAPRASHLLMHAHSGVRTWADVVCVAVAGAGAANHTNALASSTLGYITPPQTPVAESVRSRHSLLMSSSFATPAQSSMPGYSCNLGRSMEHGAWSASIAGLDQLANLDANVREQQRPSASPQAGSLLTGPNGWGNDRRSSSRPGSSAMPIGHDRRDRPRSQGSCLSLSPSAYSLHSADSYDAGSSPARTQLLKMLNADKRQRRRLSQATTHERMERLEAQLAGEQRMTRMLEDRLATSRQQVESLVTTPKPITKRENKTLPWMSWLY